MKVLLNKTWSKEKVNILGIQKKRKYLKDSEINVSVKEKVN